MEVDGCERVGFGAVAGEILCGDLEPVATGRLGFVVDLAVPAQRAGERFKAGELDAVAVDEKDAVGGLTDAVANTELSVVRTGVGGAARRRVWEHLNERWLRVEHDRVRKRDRQIGARKMDDGLVVTVGERLAG